jgi:hypothetical protein
MNPVLPCEICGGLKTGTLFGAYHWVGAYDRDPDNPIRICLDCWGKWSYPVGQTEA